MTSTLLPRHKIDEESETLSSYSLLHIDVSRLTQMNKTLLDVALMRLWIPKDYFITYALIPSLL